MGNLTRYTAADLPVLLDKISKNSIGMNDYLNRVFDLHETTTNYPPYNLIEVSNVEGGVLKELLLHKPVAFGDHKTQTRLTKELSNGKPNEVQCCQHKSTVGTYK